MLLTEIFEQLVHGELAQSAAYSNEFGEGITEAHYPAIVAHINLGLIELAKRFPIKVRSTIIQQQDDVSIYTLDRKHAQSNTMSVYNKYIMDSASVPFHNTVFKIETVKNELGEELPLNDPKNVLSVTTPAYNKIQIAYPSSANAVEVLYRSTLDKIEVDGLRPGSTEVEIPPSMLSALLLFVAYRVFNGLSDGNRDSDSYLNKFEMACAKIKELSLINHDEFESTKFGDYGWV